MNFSFSFIYLKMKEFSNAEKLKYIIAYRKLSYSSRYFSIFKSGRLVIFYLKKYAHYNITNLNWDNVACVMNSFVG